MVGTGGLDHPMIPVCGTAAAHRSPLEDDGSNAEDLFRIHPNFNFNF